MYFYKGDHSTAAVVIPSSAVSHSLHREKNLRVTGQSFIAAGRKTFAL